MLRRCKPPRCIPFQRRFTDGLNSGATLSFLKKKNFMATRQFDALHGPSTILGVNSLVALHVKRRPGSGAGMLVLQLRSESPISTMEYLRFTLLCDDALRGAVELLRT